MTSVSASQLRKASAAVFKINLPLHSAHPWSALWEISVSIYWEAMLGHSTASTFSGVYLQTHTGIIKPVFLQSWVVWQHQGKLYLSISGPLSKTNLVLEGQRGPLSLGLFQRMPARWLQLLRELAPYSSIGLGPQWCRSGRGTTAERIYRCHIMWRETVMDLLCLPGVCAHRHSQFISVLSCKQWFEGWHINRKPNIR